MHPINPIPIQNNKMYLSHRRLITEILINILTIMVGLWRLRFVQNYSSFASGRVCTSPFGNSRKSKFFFIVTVTGTFKLFWLNKFLSYPKKLYYNILPINTMKEKTFSAISLIMGDGRNHIRKSQFIFYLPIVSIKNAFC